MDLKLIYFLAWPVLANTAGFTYTIKVSPDLHKSKITVKGTAKKVVNDADRKVFQIRDVKLKDAVQKYNGRKPNDVFVKNPTPYGNFEDYEFKEVEKYTYSTSARILGIDSKPVIVTQQKLRNRTAKNGTFTATISLAVESTSSSTWSKGGEFTAGVSVEYSVQFVTAGLTMEYSANWGEESSKSEADTVSSTSTVSIELGPGEKALAKLTATKGTLRARINYESFLHGEVWCNYNPTYKGHHFFAIPIIFLQDAAQTPQEIKSQEDMSIGFYSDADVDLEKLIE